jgi:hypothetical protein
MLKRKAENRRVSSKCQFTDTGFDNKYCSHCLILHINPLHDQKVHYKLHITAINESKVKMYRSTNS